MAPVVTQIPLTPLDHLPPPNYTCSTFYLPLKAGVSPLQAFKVLQKGLQRTFVDLPWLSGKIWLSSNDASTWRPGQLEIRYVPIDPNGESPSQLKFKELSSGLTYNDLSEAAFPTDIFDDTDLIWSPFMPDLRHGCDVFVAQASFLPGGCLITGALHHAAGDGTAGFTVVRLWAENCQVVQSPQAASLPPPSEWSDRTLHEKIWIEQHWEKPLEDIDPAVCQLMGMDHPTADYGGSSTPQPSNPAQHSSDTPIMTSKIFYMSLSSFNALRNECARDCRSATMVSGTHALCALAWRGLMKARLRARVSESLNPITQQPDPMSRMDMILDGRSGFSQSLPQNYLGNHTVTLQNSTPVESLTAPDTSLASIANLIATNAATIDSENLRDMYTLLRSVPDFSEIRRKKFERFLRNARCSLLITSMLMIPIDSLSFGDCIFGNGGRPESARPLMGAFNKSTRICFILPRMENGGVEFIVNLYPEEMNLLLEDAEFGRYAVPLA